MNWDKNFIVNNNEITFFLRDLANINRMKERMNVMSLIDYNALFLNKWINEIYPWWIEEYG